MKSNEIIPAILRKAREEAKQEYDKPYPIGVYRASEIGGCARAIQYDRLGNKRETPSPELYIGILRDGHLHHRDARELLAKIGTLSHVEQTVSKTYIHKGETFIITGTLDCVFDKKVCDIKSMNTFSFKALEKKSFAEAYPNYLIQINIYMDILPFKRGFFYLKDKNNGEIKIIPVKYNAGLMELILDKIVEIQVGANNKKLIARPFPNNSWQCRYCPHRMACYRVPMENRRWSV